MKNRSNDAKFTEETYLGATSVSAPWKDYTCCIWPNYSATLTSNLYDSRLLVAIFIYELETKLTTRLLKFSCLIVSEPTRIPSTNSDSCNFRW